MPITHKYFPKNRKTIRIDGNWHICYDEPLPDKSVLLAVEKVILSGEAPEGWVSLQSSNNTKVWKFQRHDNSYIFKEYLARSYYENIKALFAGTRAKKAWGNGKMLIEQGFQTPRLWFFGEKKYGFFPFRNFLVVEFISDSSVSFVFIRNNFCHPLSSEDIHRKRLFISSLGLCIGTMHKKGIFHGDLRQGNILVKYHKDDPVFYFIDNERNRYFPRGIPDRLRMKNLVQINMIAYPPDNLHRPVEIFQGIPQRKPRTGVCCEKVDPQRIR